MTNIKILSPKLIIRCGYYIGIDDKLINTYAHWCPGCSCLHDFAVEEPFHNGAKWTFNGNIDSPTFNNSMNITIDGLPEEDILPDICHYWLKDGNIQYLNDCTHFYRGKTIPLPEIPETNIKIANIIGE